MKYRIILMSFCCAVFSIAAVAGEDEGEMGAIAKSLRTLYPSTQIDRVRPSTLNGLYEVDMGKNIGYTDREGRYFLFGHVFDMQQRQDITQQRLDELNVVNFAELPLKDAIKTVRGNGEHVLVVFSDPECTYCKRLEKELPKLNNVTIYTFLFPLDGHPAAPMKAKAIWCSPDPQVAWNDFMRNNKQPTNKQDCDNPIERNVQLGHRLGINGTPTMILADGQVKPGIAPAEQIEQWITHKGTN